MLNRLHLMLELAPSTLALTTTTTTHHLPTLTYVTGAVTDPAILAFALPSAMIGLGAAGIAGASLALACVLMFAIAVTRFALVRRHLERRVIERARQRGEAKRRVRLRSTNPVRMAQYLELRALVDELELTSPADVARHDLIDLLDYFVGLAVQHERYHKTLRLVGCDLFPTMNIRAGSRHRLVADRRRVAAEAARIRVDQLGDELDALEELVKLIVLHVLAPSQLGNDVIVERLAELDQVDHGMRQLEAMCAEG